LTGKGALADFLSGSIEGIFAIFILTSLGGFVDSISGGLAGGILGGMFGVIIGAAKIFFDKLF